ncbi:MAG TPA: molybdate ABC transporter substrate-binding protein [Acidimicrobiales bacterium]|nr:molybdate ABC transporter substrate-binding protein [Acidimicrobiales bacterium]
MPRRLGQSVLACFVALGTTACGGSGEAADSVVRVAVPASLAQVMPALIRLFEEVNDADVETITGGSALLAGQVVNGAPVDVLMTADGASMEIAKRADAVAQPIAIASNRAVIAVGSSARDVVRSPGDLARPGIVVVVCAPQAACGAVADRVLAQSGVDGSKFAREPDVNAVMTRVRLGEADAGIAYATDVRPDSRVRVIEVSPSVTTTYFAAVVHRGPLTGRVRGRAWLAFLGSPDAQAALSRAGFGPA